MLDLNPNQASLKEKIKTNSEIQLNFEKEYFLVTANRNFEDRVKKYPKFKFFFEHQINPSKESIALEANMSYHVMLLRNDGFKELLSTVNQILT
jgi:hypothetical protein